MIAVNYSNLRDNMKEYFDELSDSFETMIVTRKDENMVIMSQGTYDSLIETLHLLGSKENYDHLMKSINQYKSGKVSIHNISEDDI